MVLRYGFLRCVVKVLSLRARNRCKERVVMVCAAIIKENECDCVVASVRKAWSVLEALEPGFLDVIGEETKVMAET